jgi:Type I restriction enzyme R protein N terminus (HSDR_N)
MEWIFPPYPISTEERDGETYVWDPIRRKWLVRQPEEWVRQHLICYLVLDRKVSRARIGVEKEIRYRDLRKRFDVVIFGPRGEAHMLCECKAPEIELTEDTIHQALRYNHSLDAPHLLITNGKRLLIYSRDTEGRFSPSERWPL